MIVVSLTDIHGSTQRLDGMAEDLAAADLVLLTGDLTHFGHAEQAAEVLDAVRAHNTSVLAVSGNCDYADVEDYLIGQDVNLHRRHVVVDGVAFAGLGGSIACPFRTPNEHTEGRIKALLAEAVEDLAAGMPLVLVSHQPPLNTAVDVARGGRHVGSRSVRNFIEAHRPLACFTGHIHEGRGTDALADTRIVNPGPLRDGGYAWAEIGHGLERLELRGA